MEFINREKVFPSDASASTIASISGILVQCFGVRGPTFVVSSTCASGGAAIALAAQQILLGEADIMLVGASDAPLNGMMIAQLRAAGVVGYHDDPAKSCRPFDRSRNGLCLGEGSGFLVLESLESSVRRNVKPLGKVAGWGLSNENVGRVAVDSKGSTLVRTMRSAIAMADIDPQEVDYINAHGTGTLQNDTAEINAIAQVFGDTQSPPCSSTKPVTGHCLGATPLLEAIISVKALETQIIPPTANCEDPEFSLDVVPLHAREASLKYIISNSLGFWGSHCSLLLSKVD
jgi:3-oxoacyl-[acyl-carrier-protein] synthase II